MKNQDAVPTGAPVDEPKAETGEPLSEAELAALKEQDAETERKLAEAAAERRRAFEKVRAETPAQVVNVRPDTKCQLLGLVVTDDHTREILRTARMADWRTEVLALQAGQSAHISVLATEDEVAWFEHCEQQAKARAEVRQAVRQASQEG